MLGPFMGLCQKQWVQTLPGKQKEGWGHAGGVQAAKVLCAPPSWEHFSP